MSPTLSDETRRRLAIGLTIAPPSKNRRRKHVNNRAVGVATGLFVAAVILATGYVVFRIQ